MHDMLRDASMSDVLRESLQQDTCVVLPTYGHALYWWPRIHDMFEARMDVHRTKTALLLENGRMIRLWVPYEQSPTMPFDYVHRKVFEVKYLHLWGLYQGKVRWLRAAR